jgi:hypothetical protein
MEGINRTSPPPAVLAVRSSEFSTESHSSLNNFFFVFVVFQQLVLLIPVVITDTGELSAQITTVFLHD